jgi:hypothetical protein
MAEQAGVSEFPAPGAVGVSWDACFILALLVGDPWGSVDRPQYRQVMRHLEPRRGIYRPGGDDGFQDSVVRRGLVGELVEES